MGSAPRARARAGTWPDSDVTAGSRTRVHRVALRGAKRLAGARRDRGLTGAPAVLELTRVEE
eukprot:7033535-Pyramimonas_sp.AAC.1